MERGTIATSLMFAGAILASCGPSEGARPEIQRPDVQAASVEADLRGKGPDFALAYGIGLSVACNPELMGEGGLLDLGPEIEADLADAFKSAPDKTEAGIRAGLERAAADLAAAESEIC